jgi:hypothetical protein
LLQAWQAAARHTESKRRRVALFTTFDPVMRITPLATIWRQKAPGGEPLPGAKLLRRDWISDRYDWRHETV